MNNNSLFQEIHTASTAVATGSWRNFTFSDLQAAKELLESLPPRPKNITFNELGLRKFLEAAEIDNPPICYGFLNLTFDGVNCFLVPGQIEEYKINY